MAFWRRELEEPAIRVLARAARLTSVLDGDAPITGGELQSPRAPTRRPQPADRPERPQKVHRLSEDGTALMANRRGAPLCRDFQLGKCQPSHGNDALCPVDSRSRHQCAKCLSPGHGADRCSNAMAGAPKGRGKGKSKGKGKRSPHQY